MESEPEFLALGPDAVLYAILDQVVDEYEPVATGLENDIDEIEDELFGADPDVSRRIYELSRQVITVQRATGPLAGILQALMAGTPDHHPGPELQDHLRDVLDHVLRLNDRIASFRALLQNALAVNAALVAQRQNDEMRRLTESSFAQSEQVKRISSWAAILFAPTLIGTIYGMNFQTMPELDWMFGYPMAAGAAWWAWDWSSTPPSSATTGSRTDGALVDTPFGWEQQQAGNFSKVSRSSRPNNCSVPLPLRQGSGTLNLLVGAGPVGRQPRKFGVPRPWGSADLRLRPQVCTNSAASGAGQEFRQAQDFTGFMRKLPKVRRRFGPATGLRRTAENTLESAFLWLSPPALGSSKEPKIRASSVLRPALASLLLTALAAHHRRSVSRCCRLGNRGCGAGGSARYMVRYSAGTDVSSAVRNLRSRNIAVGRTFAKASRRRGDGDARPRPRN